MQQRSTKTDDRADDARQTAGAAGEPQAYSPPTMYFMGRSYDLLQGSGRHKNDDTGSRGFEVDQH